MVLVDTSVWIDFFSKKPVIDTASLELLIEERQVATCLPIKAEVLSGEMSPKIRTIVLQAFDSMTFLDLDWNSPDVWQKAVHVALEARKKKLGVCGLVDRMIFVAARESGASLWTLERKLKKLASSFGLLFQV